MAGFELISKKFEKTIWDASYSFYKDKKEAIKRKQIKTLKDDNFSNCKFHFKSAFFTEIIKDHQRASKLYDDSYVCLIAMKT